MFLELISYKMLAFLCVGRFVSSFVDAIAGGGGCISIPVFMLTGLPMQTIYACNKLCSACATTMAAGRFVKNKAVNWPVAIISGIFAVIGASLASAIFINTESDVMKKVVMCCLPFVAVFMLLKKDFGEQNGFDTIPKKKVYLVSAAAGLVIAFYDGLVGPGTGTFAIMVFSSILKIDLKTSSGTAKVFNLASNWASAISFMIAGYTVWPLVIIVTLFSMAGGALGAGFAIKKGTKFIRIIMTAVMAMLLVKLATEVF